MALGYYGTHLAKENIMAEDFDVQAAINEIKRDYVLRALSRTKNVSEATKLLGLKNYQTLQNWMDKLRIEHD